ncbi:DUF177 domain-containing protein [Clostridium sp. E02]|uniref:YceD family protein n=1 Tax=Clostridium sp. E02 TaxID=2487134 RepID=UPI000F52C2B0|nr:DUF177 domain-containing protein [Clostridium sp. E02]
MLINLTELFNLEGKEKTYTPDIEMKIYHGPYSDCEVTDSKPVKLRIMNLGDKKLEVEGEVKLALIIPCDRCLDPVRVDLEFEIIRTIDLNRTDNGSEEDLLEQPYVIGYNLDVDQLVCDELILNLPMKVLCSEDCKGICNRCGTNLNHETCDCDVRSTDPRMAVIQDIFKQFKEV